MKYHNPVTGWQILGLLVIFSALFYKSWLGANGRVQDASHELSGQLLRSPSHCGLPIWEWFLGPGCERFRKEPYRAMRVTLSIDCCFVKTGVPMLRFFSVKAPRTRSCCCLTLLSRPCECNSETSHPDSAKTKGFPKLGVPIWGS